MDLFPVSHRSRRSSVVLALSGSAVLIALWYFATRLPPVPQRMLRIGFENNPPVQIRTDHGPSGLAVETINEAAKRAEIRLQWVETGTSSDEAFRKGLVDLWPLMVDLPDRRKRVHFARPWMHSSDVLLMRESQPSPDHRFTGRIAVFKMPLHVSLVRKYFPTAHVTEVPEIEDIIKQVCMGTADAGFLEARMAMTELREKPPECTSMALRVQSVPTMTFDAGLGSTFESAGAADKIQREIDNMFGDGSLAVLIAKYSYFGLEDTWASYRQVETERSWRWLTWVVGGLVLALGLMLWQASSLRQRKRAEAVLRESEERFRVIFFQAAVGIAQTGPDGQWLLVNDRFCEMLGYSQTELSGKTFLDITHLDDREASLMAVRKLLAGEISGWLTEKRYIRKDGNQIWVRLFTSLVRDQHNQPQYFISVVEDVTEQKLIEERLRAREAQLMEAQRLAKVGSWERHIKSDTIHWSEEMFRILGLADGAPSHFATFLSFIHPKDREKILEIDDKVRSSIAPVEVEYRIIRPDGEARSVRSIVEGIRDDQGVAVRITGATQDITEQVKARELLRESEGHLKSAARLAHVGYWHWDLQTNRVSGSDEMYRIFGKPHDYTPSYDDFLQTVIPQDRERVARWVSDCLAEQRGTEIEYQIVWPNGDLRTVSCISELSLGDEGMPTRMFGACQDVTDFRRAQDESFARQKLESVGTLASGIAHDFNNLLGGVLAHAELALTELAGGSRPEEELQRIRAATIRGAEIVRQLMIYSGQESESIELVDVSGIVEEMLELLKLSVSKHAVVETDLGTDLPSVRANSGELQQVVMNLITNASEAIGNRDGVIRVTTRRETVGPHSSVASSERLPEGDYLRLEVSDTGCGMTSDAQARIFDPFFTTKPVGHGLGLAVVQGIVRGLRGTICLVSAPGKGTTVQIWLPCAEPTQATASKISWAEEEKPLSQEPIILVVEDEVSLRRPVSKMLRNVGFCVIEASDGSAALDMIRTHKDHIRALLLDISLPGTPSRQVYEEAKRLIPDVRIIATSAYSEDMAAVSLGGHGDRFIRKPYRLDHLAQSMREILSS